MKRISTVCCLIAAIVSTILLSTAAAEAKQRYIAKRPGEVVFLRGLANRLYDEGVFSVVVTPYFDNLHRNHIHVDLARYRVDGSRP